MTTSLIRIAHFKDWKPLKNSYKAKDFFEYVSIEDRDPLYDDFAKYVANYLKAIIKGCIRTQQFPTSVGSYRPHSPRYRAFKERTGRNKGFWIATGFLVDNLQVYKVRSIIYIGYPKGMNHPDNGYPLWKIVLVNEKGSPRRNIAARPLFLPASAAISKDIFRHFVKFIEAHPIYREYAMYLPKNKDKFYYEQT